MTRKTKAKNQRTKVPESGQRLIEVLCPSRRQGTRLELPVGEPDREALSAVNREWLVPLLVQRFLREQGIEIRSRLKADPGKNEP